MFTHQTNYRVIYGDTDNMGLAYHANYLRWFEMGRCELFRAVGMTYKSIEAQGIFLPVAEAQLKYLAPARYDDLIVIQATLDEGFKAGVKFKYRIFSEDQKTTLAKGYTIHACVNQAGRVTRPPAFLKAIIDQHLRANRGAEDHD